MFRQIHHADNHPARIRKIGKDFAKELVFKDVRIPVKIRNIHKIEKKNYVAISIFGYENTKISNPCFKKMLWRKT